MSSTTTRLGLYKPDGTENVNRTTDINNNWDNIDGKMGFVPLTSSTHPASAYQGEAIYETDTLKAYVNSSAVASAATYKQILVEGADFDNNVSLGSSATFRLANTTDVSLSSTNHAFQIGSSSSTNIRMDNNELMAVNNGAASTLHINPDGGNTTINNNVAASGQTMTIKAGVSIEDTLAVTSNATFGGNLTISTGNLVIGSATYRNNLSAASTVSNTTTETAIAAWNIPANDVVVGAVYRIKAWGTLTVTGTPTITFSGKVGGTTMVSVPAITVRSGATDGQWRIEYIIAVTATGVGGAAAPMLEVQHNFLTSATTWTALGPATAAPVSRDFSVLASHHITAQWSAASASNTIVCRGFAAERVA